jgi:phosphatidylserine decarboxylase
VTPRTERKRIALPLDASHAPLTLARSAELARFNMGSTVILLLPAGAGEWLGTLAAGSVIRVGTALGHVS